MFTVKHSRLISGFLFLFSNVYLFVNNLVLMDIHQLISSILFITCSVSVILSAYHHRWLFWGGTAVGLAYVLIALSERNENVLFQTIGAIIGIIAGALIFRSALQAETGKQYAFKGILKYIDHYPLAAAGVIEGTCCLAMFIGAILSDDLILIITSGLWVIAHSFLIGSDNYLRKDLQLKKL